MQIPDWIIALGTIAGVAVAWLVAKASGRAEAERYSREQSKEKEDFKLALAKWQVRIEFMVDQLWVSQGRRGTTAAVIGGLGEVHSPLKATARGREIFKPITDEVDVFYREEGHAMTEGMLRATIENRFGDRIMHDFCIPNGFMQSECIEIIVAITREDYNNLRRVSLSNT